MTLPNTRLSTTFRTDIVSSRGEEAAGPLRSWLGLNCPGMRQNIVIVEKHSDKSILPYNIFIDDAPRLAGKIRDTEGKLLLLIDAPYNMSIGNSEKIMHFRDVNAACAELLRYSAHAMRGP